MPTTAKIGVCANARCPQFTPRSSAAHLTIGLTFREAAVYTYFTRTLRERDGAVTLFADYLREWHRRRSPILADGRVVRDADLHPSTWIHDSSVIRTRLIPALGIFRLHEITTAHCNALRRSIIDEGRSGKTASNVLGLLHKALGDAVEEGLIEKNPVIRATSRKVQRSRRAQRLTANPLRPEEVSRFLDRVPEWYRDFYRIWFHTGWRSSEIVAIRFGWLDFHRQTVALKRGRMPRFGGLEAEPKTGPREVDCSYAPRNLLSSHPAEGAGRIDWAGGLRVHEPCGPAFVAGAATRPSLDIDIGTGGNPASWSILHPRYFHHARAVVGRRSWLGGTGLRNFGRNDFPPLPALDSRIKTWRGRKDLRNSSLSRASFVSISVPKTVPRRR